MVAKTCGYLLAWIGKCSKMPAPGFAHCDEHKDLKCCSCGKPASRQCEHTGAFVCGFDLCDTCQHGVIMPGGDFGLFSMGGGHVTKEKYAEQMKEYQRIEPMMLHWNTIVGEDCVAQSNFGNFYVLINHDTRKFVASFNHQNLSEKEIDTKQEAMKLCQQHHVTLCEEKTKAGG